MGKGKGKESGRWPQPNEHRTSNAQHRTSYGEWGSSWRRFDLGTKYVRSVVSQGLLQKTRSWLVVVGSGRVGEEAARSCRAEGACARGLPTHAQVRDTAGMLRLRGTAPEPAIAQLLVSPARNSGETQCNILRRKLMQVAFHSMFDVGRSMLDVRFPLVAASGRPVLSVVRPLPGPFTRTGPWSRGRG